MTLNRDTYAICDVEEVESYLAVQPDGFDFKRGHELLAGCVLARCAMTGEMNKVAVGFRLAPTQNVASKEKPPLSHLLSEFDLEDRDVDIVIGNDDWLSPYQITRVGPRGKGKTSEDRLMAVLRKKMLVQLDPKLTLAILMDEDFNLKYDVVHEHLLNISVPYGRILLLGQTGPAPKLGCFECIEIYPELTITPAVHIRMR